MKKFLKYLLLILFLFFVLCFLFFITVGIYLPKEAGSTREEIFIINKGEGTEEISLNLEKQGLISEGLFFRIYTLTKGVAKNIQAGNYLLSPSMTIPEITEKFILGDVAKEEITIIEGWDLRDIAWYFEGKGMFQSEELFELAGFPLIDYSETKDLPLPKDFSNDFTFLKDKPKNLGLEGYLFPDTYQVVSGTSIEEIVRKMLNNFDRKLTPDLREEIERQEKSIFEIITMASLLEIEVRAKEDKEIVSAIFWKRIKERRYLQSCATIAYIKGENQWRYSYEDTRIESPYNTYLNFGLPLGPVSNPGIESIEAAIFPKETDYNYFLTDPETGETIFSKTLEEHNKAKDKYF